MQTVIFVLLKIAQIDIHTKLKQNEKQYNMCDKDFKIKFHLTTNMRTETKLMRKILKQPK